MRIGVVATVLLLTSIQFILASPASGQSIEDVYVKIELHNESIVQAFHKIESQSRFRFMYRREDLQQFRSINMAYAEKSVAEVLKALLANSTLSFKQLNSQILIVPADGKIPAMTADADEAVAPVPVKGKVTNAKGEPLVAVSVTIKGTNIGTSTNERGEFSLSAEPADVLVFSNVGFVAQEIVVGAKTNITVKMVEEDKAMEEVVVTSFGIQRDKKTLGYGVAKLNTDEINNSPTPDITNALAGKVAGVQVSGTGGFGSSNVTIRGFSSITRSNQPLYVVDGVPIDNSGGGNSVNSGVANSSRVADINPEDIENVSVLKGAAATVLYGSRAASGVILITTKKGKTGRTSVSVSSNTAIGTVNRFPEYQNEYAQGTNGMYGDATDPTRWVARATSWGPRIEGQEVTNILGDRVKLQAYPNNVRDILRHSQSYDNTVSFSGASDKYNYRVSYGNNIQVPLVPGNTIRRNNFSVNAGAKLSNKLKLNTSFSYVNNRADRTQAGNQGANPLWRGIYAPRSYDVTGLPVTDDQGNQIWYSTSEENPYWSIEHIRRQSESNRFFGNINLNYAITKWLQADLKIGADVINSGYIGFDDKGVRSNGNTNSAGAGGLVDNKELARNLSSYFTLSGNRTVGDFNLSGTVGNEVVADYSNFLTTTGRSITIPGFANLKNFTSFTTSDGYTQTRLFGVFADFSVDYRQIVNLNVKARNDFSSTLTKQHRSIFYPAVAVSFVATEAIPSLKDGILDYLKIRANMGEVGKGAGAYATNTYYGTASAGDGFGSTGVSFPFNGLAGYTYQNSAGNPDIRPEFTREIELGTEAYFFNRRLSVDLSVYKRESRDLIFSVPVPVSSGFSSTVKNAGRLSTKGIEFLVSGTPIKRQSFTWEATLNFTSFKTMVTELAEGVDMISLGGFTSPNIQAVAGQQYGLIYSNRYVRDAQGRMIIRPNGLPSATSAVGQVGNPNPKLTAGLTNSFKYKNWNFSFLLDLKYKGDVMSRTIGDLRINGVAKETAEYNRFNSDGTVATPYLFPGVTNDGKENTTYVTAQQYWGLSGKYVAWEGYVLDATYLKLREANLSYTFNKNALAKMKYVTRLELALYGRNLLTYAPNYPHLDPEQNLLGISNARGLEFGYQATPRTVGLSVKASF